MSAFAAVLILQLKRLLRRPAVLVCLLVVPVLALGLGLAAGPGKGQSVRVGVLLPEDSAHAPAIWDSLSQDGGIQFVLADTQQELEDRVAGGEWECGYLLPFNLDDRLKSGRYARLIVRVDGPATTLGSVVDWSVAAAVLDSCAVDIANAVLANSDVLSPREEGKYASLARDIFVAQSALQMDVTPLNGGTGRIEGEGGRLTAAALVRGVLALALLLFSCLCAVCFSRDMQAGFFVRIQPCQGRARLYLSFFAASAALAAVAGLLSLAAARTLFPGYFSGFGREAFLLGFYLLPLGAFSFLLSALFSGRELLVCLLPFLMMGCLLLCPILVDLSAYVLWLGPVSMLLPPTAYLRAAAGAAAPWGMLLQAGFYTALGLACSRVKKKL